MITWVGTAGGVLVGIGAWEVRVGRPAVGVYTTGVTSLTISVWEGRAVRVWTTEVARTSAEGVGAACGKQALKSRRSRIKTGRRRFIYFTPRKATIGLRHRKTDY
jgi:hypothetical protein